MATDAGQQWELRNDTAVNVAGLLKEQIGATREYRLLLDRLELDGDVNALQIDGHVRLTRLRDGVLAKVKANGSAPLSCARCLREYEQPFTVSFDEEFRQTVDVRTGLGLGTGIDEDAETSFIDENHVLDLQEPLRQEILIALPMRPDCGPDCPGPDAFAGDDEAVADEAVDDRLAALASLLPDDQDRD
jgi:uncharacterized protein